MANRDGQIKMANSVIQVKVAKSITQENMNNIGHQFKTTDSLSRLEMPR